MNRRGFLSLAAAAPVALPMAAKAAAQNYASGGYLTGEIAVFGEVVGIDGGGVGPFLGRHHPITPILAEFDKRCVAELADERAAALSVEQQMIEHDLFEISDHQNVRVPNASG